MSFDVDGREVDWRAALLGRGYAQTRVGQGDGRGVRAMASAPADLVDISGAGLLERKS